MSSLPQDSTIYTEAFQRWWDADYSVEGLKKKLVPPALGRPITLHEYWFKSERPPKTVVFAKREWTTFHLPTTDLAGNPSEKATWSANAVEQFYNEVARREGEGTQAYNNYTGGGDEADRPHAFFDGVVFPDYSKSHFNPGAMPSYADAIFEGVARFESHSPGNASDFRRAIFRKEALFSQHVFHIRADFDGAAFLVSARFNHAAFTGQALFRKVLFTEASFESVGFHGSASFSDSRVRGKVSFGGGQSQWTVFDGVMFEGEVDFHKRPFRRPVFVSPRTHFKAGVIFRDCEFHDRVQMSALFSGPADFSCKSGGTFDAEADFSGARFISDVDFSGREFLRSTQFASCLFKRAPQFHGAKPHSSTTFSGCRFEATVGEAHPSSLLPASKASKIGTALSRVLAIAVSRGLSRGTTAAQILTAIKTWTFRWIPFAEWLPPMKFARDTRNAATKQHEDAYRTLRHLMETDGELQGLFYSLEMDTRRRRTDVSSVERWALFLFWLSSGYGRYLGRPFLVLLGAIGLVTALLSWWLAYIVWPDIPPSTGEVFAFSSRLFLLPSPFPAAMDGSAKVYWIVKLLKSSPAAFTLLSALCAITSTALVGVLAVTLRRRFALK